MIENLIFLILGAGLGVAADRTWDRVASATRTRRASAQSAQRAGKEAKIRGAIVELYGAEGYLSSLYVPANLPGGPIAMLGSSRSSASGPVLLTQDFPLTLENANIEQMPVNHAVIEAQKRAGANLWDGEILFLKSASVAAHAEFAPIPALDAGVMNYFGFISASAAWRAECESKGPHRTLQEHYASLDTLLRNPPRALALSAAATCVFSTPGGPHVPLARRSPAVVNAMGDLCLAPTFGLEPMGVDHVTGTFDVLKYNFLKEFLEEVYGLDALTHNAEEGLLDPAVIFDNPAAQRLLDEFDGSSGSRV